MSKLLEFCKDFDRKEFLPEQDIITIGEAPSKTIYILIHGVVDITFNDTFISSLSKPGTVLGEISALLDIPRTTTVRASERCQFFLINDIRALFETSIDASLEVTRLEFNRLFRVVNNLIRLKNEFLDAVAYIGLDMTKITQMDSLMAQWNEMQDTITDRFPFILESDVGEYRTIHINPGEILFKEGENIERFYSLKEGTMTHSRHDGAFSFNVTRPGTVLNMGYALVNCKTMTTVAAKDAAIVKEVDNIKNLFRTEHSAGYEILKQIAERIVLLTEAFVQIKGKLFGIDENISGELKEGMKKLTEFILQKEKLLQETLLKSD